MKKEHVHHSVLILRFAVGLSREIEAILTRDPRMASRSPQVLSNYDNIIQDILNRIQHSAEETRNLHGKLQEHSQRITSLERKVASSNLPGTASSGQRLPDSENSLPNSDINKRLTNLENKTADHEVLLVENNRTTVETSRELANVKRQVETTQETARRTERRMESIEHTLALRNVTLADLEEYVRQQEFSSYDGQLIWKIVEYARRRNEGKFCRCH